MKFFESAVNKLLLGFGFTMLAYVLSYYLNEASYDSWVEEHQQIYRVDNVVRFEDQPAKHDPAVPLIIADSLGESFSNIEETGIYSESWLEYILENQAFEMELSLINQDFITIFSVDPISGRIKDLFDKPNTIAIAKALSEKIFGVDDAIGKLIRTTTDEVYEVVAVFDDWPKNSHLKVEAMIDYHPHLLANEPAALNNYGRSRGQVYVKLTENTSLGKIEEEIQRYFEKVGPPQYFEPTYGHDYYSVFNFTLIPLIDASKYTYAKPVEKNSNKEAMLMVLTVTAFSIFLIGLVNFLIYNNNQTITYLFESSLKLTFGASNNDMFVDTFRRSFLNAVLIYFISIILYFVLSNQINAIVGFYSQPRITDLPLFILFIVLFFFALVASGLFVLKTRKKSPKQVEEMGFSNNGARKMGQFYVLLQIAVTCFLICMSLTMKGQLASLLGDGKGYSTDNLIVLWDYEGSPTQSSLNRIQSLLSQEVGIENVSLSGFVPGDNRDSSMSVRSLESNKTHTIERMNIGMGTLDLLGVEVLSGRLFERGRQDEVSDDSDLPISIVINEKATHLLGYSAPSDAIGSFVDQRIGGNGSWRKAKIIGVISDYNFKSAFKTIPATMFYAQASRYDRLVIKTPDYEGIYNRVQSIWLNMNPNSLFDFEPLNNYLASLYDIENKQLRLVFFISVFGLIMSCVGIFNSLKQNYIENQFEFNMHKSFGVGWLNIFVIFVARNTSFLIVGVVLSIPVYWLASKSWLSKFTVVYGSNLLSLVSGISIVMLTALLIFGIFIPGIRSLDISSVRESN